MGEEDARDGEGRFSHPMDEDRYLGDRLDDQLQGYDRKSTQCQGRYKMLRAIEMICAAFIPFMVGPLLDRSQFFALVAGALGVTISIVAGLMASIIIKKTGSSTARRRNPSNMKNFSI